MKQSVVLGNPLAVNNDMKSTQKVFSVADDTEPSPNVVYNE